MSSNCDLILKWGATPGELRSLGAALWRWCTRAAGNAAVYRYLDNQPLADLIAGRLPESNQTDARGIHLWILDSASSDRQALIDCLRREIPTNGVEDIMIDGTSWNQEDSTHKLVAPPFTRVRREEIDDRRAETAPRPSFASCEFNHNLE